MTGRKWQGTSPAFLVAREPLCNINILNLNSTWLHSLAPGDVIWHHGIRSTRVKVLVWCLMAQNHYPYHCWLVIFAGSCAIHQKSISQDISLKFYQNAFENNTFEIRTSPRAQWVNTSVTTSVLGWWKKKDYLLQDCITPFPMRWGWCSIAQRHRNSPR